jgi:putative ABC transport system ATP-binding protein
LGFVFQAFFLLPTLSAIENVQIPMFETSLPLVDRVLRARELLDIVGLGQRENHLPSQLSIGERQRVAIARALANRPSLLLADEPTGNLDSKNAEEVMNLFHRLHDEGMTIVMVTHSDEIATHADRLICLRDGRIIEDGNVSRRSAAV